MPAASPQDLNAWQSFGVGIHKGIDMLQVGIGTAAESLGETGENVFGSPAWAEHLDEWGRAFQQDALQSMERIAMSTNPEGKLAWAMDAIGSAAPLMVGAAAAGAATAAGAAAAGVTSTAGLAVASVGGASAAMYPTEKGFLQNDLEEGGLSEEDADFWSSVGAIPIAMAEGVFEGLSAGIGTGRVAEKFFGRGARGILTDRILSIATGSGLEGVTEATQEIINMGIVGGLTGQVPEREEIINRIGESFMAGLVVGGAFETVGSFATGRSRAQQEGQQVFTEESGLDATLTSELAQALNEKVAEIRVADLSPGATIGTKEKLSNGAWIDRATGKFTSAPTDAVVTSQAEQAATNAQMTEQVSGQDQPIVPLGVNVKEAAANIAAINADPTVTPEVAEIATRHLSANYRGSAIRTVRDQDPAEVNAKVAHLENIALDPNNGADYSTRVSALANARAIESAIRAFAAEKAVVTEVDTSIGAKALLQLDDAEFEAMAVNAEQSNNELLKKQFNEAAAMRANMDNLVESNSNEVRKRLNQAARETSRGLKAGASIVTPDGQVAEVKNVRPSGFVDAVIEGQEGLTLVNPADITIIPPAGADVKLAGGTVATVTEVSDGGKALAKQTDGNVIVIDLSDIDTIGLVASEAAALANQAEVQAQPVVEADKVPLPAPIEVVNSETGQVAEVVSAGREQLELADGSTIERNAAKPVMDDESRFVANATDLPVFRAGTQPARPGNHINFLQVNEALADVLEATIKSNKSNQVINDFLVGTNNPITLFPQANRPGTITFAVEMPSDARKLSKGSKAALSFLSGKSDKAPSFRTQVEITRELSNDEVAIMWVPPALLTNVSEQDFVGRSPEEQREYLRRLTDLGFDAIPAPVSKALHEAQQAHQEARDARIIGDVGTAEIAEIEAMAARAEAAQRAIEADIQERKAEWDKVLPALNTTMTPRERTVLDVLNFSEEDQLRALFKLTPNVGPVLAERIIEARNDAGEGGFRNLKQILDLPGLSDATLENIKEAARKSNMDLTDPLSGAREDQLADFFISMPGRKGPRDIANWIPSFEHPSIPGMKLIIDKEVIPSASSATENVRRTEEEVREMLGGMQEVEFNGQTIEIDPIDQLGEGDLERIMGGQQVEERPIFHVSYITPEGATIRARSIGSENMSFEVPVSFGSQQIDERGFASPGRGVQRLTQLAAEGGDLDAAVEEMRANRREIEKVRIMDMDKDNTMINATVIDRVSTRGQGGVSEPTNLVVVEDEDGRRFEVREEQIISSNKEPEGNTTITLPKRFTPEQQAREVVRMVRGFIPKAKFFTVGEWRSSVPGVYAEIRPFRGEVTNEEGSVPHTFYRVMMMRAGEGRVMETMKLYEPSHIKDFDTQEDARQYLNERGFRRGKSSDSLTTRFATLPPVDKLDDIDLQIAHDEMTSILNEFVTRGHIPAPVRTYGVALAQTLNEKKMTQHGGIYRRRYIRKALNIYNDGDLQAAARRGLTQTQQPKGNIFVQDGKVAIERPTPGQIAEDVRVMDGILLSENVEYTNPAKLETAKALYRQEQHRERFFDHALYDGADPSLHTQQRLVRIGREGRLGVILEANHAKNRLIVQFFRNGERVVAEVRKEDVKRERSPDKLQDYLRTVKDSFGEMTNLPTTPTIGTSPIDKKMGLDGVTDRASYMDGLRRRVGDIFRQLHVHPDGTVSGNTDLMPELADIWIRMRELEIPNKVFAVEDLVGETSPDVNYDFADKYGLQLAQQLRVGEGSKALKADDPLFPPALIVGGAEGFAWQGVIPELAYERIASSFSTVSPYGAIMARAKLGQIPNNIEKQITDQAKRFGVETEGRPFYAVVEDMIQNVWDPSVANAMFQRRREIDLLTFASGMPANFKHGIQVRQPATGHAFQTITAFGANFAFPRTLANRHPTIRMFVNLLEKHRLAHVNEVSELDQLLIGANRLDLSQKEVIRDLWESTALGDAMTRPSDILTEEQIREADPELAARADSLMPNEWYSEYAATREQLIKVRRWNIRNGLFRGFTAVPFEFSDNMSQDDKLSALDVAKKENNVSEAEFDAMRKHILRGGTAYNLSRISNPATARPDSEINTFLDLTDQYASLEDVPAAAREKMKEWMIEEYDFWARFGDNNYGPRILQGRHKIKMVDPAGGEDVVVAFTPDGASAQKFFFDVSRGKYEGIPANAEMYIEIGMARADDLDSHYLGSAAFAKMYSALVKEYSGPDGKATELARATIKALKLGSERAAPRDLHMQARVANLNSLIEDPYKALKIYHDRTSRNNFLLNVNHAYHTSEKLDFEMSIGSGVNPVFPKSEAGALGQKAAHSYLRNLRDNAMGVQPEYEKTLSRVVALLNVDASKIPTLWRKRNLENYTFMNDPEIFPMLYNEDFALRETARKWNKFQTLFRLGGNIGGSLINSAQNLMLTPSNLMSHGYGAGDSMRFMWEGYMGAFRSLAPARFQDPKMNEFFQQIGIESDVITGAGESGLNIQNPFRGKKPQFSDDAALKKWAGMAEALLMVPFGKAENLTRRGAAIAALRAAESKGMTEAQANQFVRSHIDDTQFQYYDMALPPFMRGSLARILFQFAHFPANALKYEKDLFVGSGFVPKALSPESGTLRGQTDIIRPDGSSVPASTQARKALAYHLAVIGATGGLTGLALRPLLAPLSWLTALFTDDKDIEEAIMNNFGGGLERMSSVSDGHVGDPELWKARNLILYGIPGLLGLQLSQRVGVSGLDVNPARFDDLLLGPTGGLYRDIYKGLYGQEGFRRVNPQAATAGVVAGAILTPLITRRFPVPHALAAFSSLSTYGASELVGHATLEEFTGGIGAGKGSRAGGAFRSALLPTIAEASISTAEIFSRPEIYDRNLQERQYGTVFNKAFEAGSQLLGFQTIRSAEERALLSYVRNGAVRASTKKRIFTEMIVSKMIEHNGMSEEVMALHNEANLAGAGISQDDIDQAFARRGMSPLEKASKAATISDRVGGAHLPR
jgi:DNA uptake protein ComE-like DNA-binding protein